MCPMIAGAPVEMNAMKTALLIASLLCATTALAQTIGVSMGGPSMTAPFQMLYHDQHASPHAMAEEHSLLEGSGSVYIAHGEIPLWEVAPPDPPYVPLGDTARLLRKQHETARKASVVFEKQGK
jgi:hypothetical protein